MERRCGCWRPDKYPKECMGLDEITAGSTVAIAVITLGYAIVTWRMLNASTQSIALTREIFEKSHRPYIVIESVCLIKEANDNISLRPMLYNCGTVPARILHVHADFTGVAPLEIDELKRQFSIPPLTRDSSLAFGLSAPDGNPLAKLDLATFRDAPSWDNSEWTCAVKIDFSGVKGTRYNSSATFHKTIGQPNASSTSSDFS